MYMVNKRSIDIFIVNDLVNWTTPLYRTPRSPPHLSPSTDLDEMLTCLFNSCIATSLACTTWLKNPLQACPRNVSCSTQRYCSCHPPHLSPPHLSPSTTWMCVDPLLFQCNSLQQLKHPLQACSTWPKKCVTSCSTQWYSSPVTSYNEYHCIQHPMNIFMFVVSINHPSRLAAITSTLLYPYGWCVQRVTIQYCLGCLEISVTTGSVYSVCVLKQSMHVYSLHTRKGNIFVVYIICGYNFFPSKCNNKLLHDKRINNNCV